jgi:hypothetical protein
MVTNGPMLYVGIVLVLCGLLFLYFRRKVNSLEYKVNTLFTLVQDHIDKQKEEQQHADISIYPTEPQNENIGVYEDGNVEQLIPVSEDELSSEEESSEEEEESSEEEELSGEESQSDQVKTINIGGASENQGEFEISLDNLESVELSLKDSISTQDILKELMEQTEDLVEEENGGTQGGNGSIEEVNLEELTEELTEEETEEEELSEEEGEDGQDGGVIEVTKTSGSESVEEATNVENGETKAIEIDLSSTSELELTKLTVPRLRELILIKDPNANVKKLKKNALIALLQSE